jgi:hypothetical protein
MRDEATASRSTARGFSDMQVRTKINFWGNDGKSDTALGLMPFIQLPTGSDSLSSDHVEGGIIVPFAMKLTDNIDLSAMADWNFVYDPADRGYDTEFVHTVSLGFAFTEELGAYIEYVGIASTDGDSGYQALASTGVVYKITRDLQVDAGVQIGLTRAAEDLVVFSGFSVRF